MDGRVTFFALIGRNKLLLGRIDTANYEEWNHWERVRVQNVRICEQYGEHFDEFSGYSLNIQDSY